MKLPPLPEPARFVGTRPVYDSYQMTAYAEAALQSFSNQRVTTMEIHDDMSASLSGLTMLKPGDKYHLYHASLFE